MAEYYSAINVPTDTEGFVETITSDVVYYVGATGDDTLAASNNNINNPWASLTKCFSYIANKRIAKGKTVTFFIKNAEGVTGWNQHLVDDTEVEILHPDADKIIIEGQAPNDIEIYAVNYYDSALRAMGSTFGGYLMELTVADGDATNVEVGNFINITDTNYSPTSEYVTGVSGPTFLETDFDHYNSGPTSGLDISGNSYDAGPLSLRKTLMLGCHEVLGVDTNTGLNSDTILLHVRHNNHTHNSYVDHVSGPMTTGVTQAYVTPQSLRWISDNGSFQTGTTQGTHAAGYVDGTDYNPSGIEHRLWNYNRTLPLSSGFTAGATGAYAGWTYGGTGSDYGGASGGNGYWWDKTPYNAGLAGQGGATAAFRGVKGKLIQSRVNFSSSNGLTVKGTELGTIKNLVLCGPGFGVGVTSELRTDGTNGLFADQNGGINTLDNVGIVGFDNGIRSSNNSMVNAQTAVVSACRHGFVADQNGHLRANHGIASGCYIGYYALNQSHIDSDYSISVGNSDDGYYASNNSSINASYSLSCMNAGFGFAAVDSSTMRLTKQGSVKGYEGTTTLQDATTQDARYGTSDKSGSFAFKNVKAGVYGEASNIYADNSRSTYNGDSGYLLVHGSYGVANFANAYYNGYSGDTEGRRSGVAVDEKSGFQTYGGNSWFNHNYGYAALDDSHIHHSTGTADNNGVYAFYATYGSKIQLESTSHGSTSNGSTGAPGPSGPHPAVAINDAIIFTDGANLGAADTTAADAIGTYTNNGKVTSY